MNVSKKEHILLIVSMFIFGTIGLFVKYIPLSSGEIALHRAILAIVVIGIYLFVTKSKLDFNYLKKYIPLLLLSGIALYNFLKMSQT